MIDFSKIPENEMPEFLGGTGSFHAKIFNDGQNKILMGRLFRGDSIGMHCHKTSSEIIYVLEGEGIMKLENGEEKTGVCDGGILNAKKDELS